jgi:hypothetical protein
MTYFSIILLVLALAITGCGPSAAERQNQAEKNEPIDQIRVLETKTSMYNNYELIEVDGHKFLVTSRQGYIVPVSNDYTLNSDTNTNQTLQ